MCAKHMGVGLHAALEEQLKQYFETAIIKRGYQYYMDGHVESVRTSEYNALYGIVKGSHIYAVVLDTEHFQYSSCACPYEGYCKHMAAVFFEFCSKHEGGHLYAQDAYFRLLGLQKAAQAVSSASVSGMFQVSAASEQPAELEPLQWLEWMEEKHGDTWLKCRNSLHALMPVLSALKGMSKDWEKPRQRLHWSLSILFVLEQAERAITSVDSFSRYYHEMSFMRMAEPWVQHLFTLVSELAPEAMDDEEWVWAYLIAGICKGNAMRTEAQLFDWTTIYLSVADKFAEDRGWYELELKTLLEDASSASEETTNVSFLHIAIGMLYFYDKLDSLAIEHFSEAKFERSQKIMYPCAARRMQEEEWELAKLWMSFFYDRIYPVRNPRNVGVFLTLCRRADKDRPDMPIWNEYMLSMLPHSYYELSEHWLDQSDYSKWADLQMLMGVRADDLETAVLREVAKAAPRVLMPLYHQSIDAWIQTRNRQGYRMAVKGLKKLEKLYKADKDTARWDRYIAGIAQKHQRLRAFQEELWKGKLIT